MNIACCLEPLPCLLLPACAKSPSFSIAFRRKTSTTPFGVRRESHMDDTSTNQQSSHLYALMLKLRPRAAGEVLPNAGQLAHAALLAWLKEVDPALAARLHEPNNDRPFTCSSLWFPDERAVALAH